LQPGWRVKLLNKRVWWNLAAPFAGMPHRRGRRRCRARSARGARPLSDGLDDFKWAYL